MPKKNSVAFNRRPDPPFIRQLKERIAYKEGDTVDTKKQKLQEIRDIEREDEIPQVVQLKSGDLSEQEYKELKSKQDIEESASSSGKILFKKPTKRQIEEIQEKNEAVSSSASISASSVTDKKKLKKIEEIYDRSKSSGENTIKAVKNKQLLSFGEDEEEQE